MIAVPFIYFLFFLIYAIKHKSIYSMSTILILAYVITSFFTIVLDQLDAYSNVCPNTKINFLPTFLYCLLITYVIYPFYRIQDHKIVQIEQLKKSKYLDRIVHLYFIIFVMLVVFLYRDIIIAWNLANIDENLKGEISSGEIQLISLTGPILTIINICIRLSSVSIFLLPIFFYNITFREKSRLFYIENFLGSMCILVYSVLTQDRSRFVYWFLIFLICLVFFYRFFTRRIKRNFFAFSISIVVFIIAYLIIMNDKRYSARTEFSSSDFFLVSYAGQSFINFCHFYENLNLPRFNFEGPFPVLSHFFSPDELNTTEWAMYLRINTGVNTLTFSTFIGFLASYIGFYWASLWVLGYGLICRACLSNKKVYSLFDFMVYIALIYEPYLGIFGSPYHGFLTEIGTIIILIICFFSCRISRRNNYI